MVSAVPDPAFSPFFVTPEKFGNGALFLIDYAYTRHTINPQRNTKLFENALQSGGI